MADTENIFRPMEVYWSKDETDVGDTSLVYVPGMKDAGNRRPERRPPRVKGRKTAEVKPSIPVCSRQAKAATMLATTKPAPTMPVHSPNKEPDKSKSGKLDKKQASLKDLCPEDKKRVANLVKELARVGEERETVLHVLDKERKLSEKQINDLVRQQDDIMKERQDIQKQLLSCQELLAKFQRLSQDSRSKDDARYAEDRKAEFYTPEKPADIKESQRKRERSRSRERQDSMNAERKRQPDPSAHRTPPRQAPQQSKGQNSYSPSEEARKEFWGGGTTVNKDSNGYRMDRAIPEADTQNELSDRPFTSKLDHLIEAERHSQGEFTEPPQHNSKRSPSTPFPLNAPVQSSTLRSDFSTDSGSVKNDFKPLLPDPSPYSSGFDTDAQNGLASSQSNGNRVEFKEPLSSKFPSDLGEEQFMQKYKQLQPDDRRKELQAQRQALLEEQKSLKSVLEKQEQLLISKKEQLRKQQEIQKQRLQYFEQNGHFPPNTFSEQLIESDAATVDSKESAPVIQSDTLSIPSAQPTVAPQSLMPQQVHHPPQPAYPPQWEGPQPARPPPQQAYPPPAQHQIGPPLPPAHAAPYVPGTHQYLPHTIPGYDPKSMPHPASMPYQMTEEEMVIQSLRNMEMDRRRQNYTQPGTNDPSAYQHGYPPSPQRITQQVGIIPDVDHGYNASSHRLTDPWVDSSDHHRHQNLNSSRRSQTSLLDIVDQVEGGRRSSGQRKSRPEEYERYSSDNSDRLNRSHESCRGRTRQEGTLNSSLRGNTSSKNSRRRDHLDHTALEVTSEDELEESKVLEDIFFLNK